MSFLSSLFPNIFKEKKMYKGEGRDRRDNKRGRGDSNQDFGMYAEQPYNSQPSRRDDFEEQPRNNNQRQDTVIGSGSGVIKFFNKGKGFGFIEQQSGKDLFVHITQMPRDVEFKEGDPVSFDIAEGKRGHVATNVVLG